VLLARLGGPSKEADKSLPKDLLVEMMDVREEVESAIESGNKEELSRLREWAGKQKENDLGLIAGLLDRAAGAAAGDRGAVLREIRLRLNALGYIQRMIDQMPR
jgi:hypothetical protein